MKISENSGSGVKFTPVDAGTHVARCVSLIDLGTQENEFQGEKKVQHQIFVMFEIPNELHTYEKEGVEVSEPFTASSFYTASLHEKAKLRKHLTAWRGKEFTPEELMGFELKNVLGHPCMLTIVHKTKKNGDVSAVIDGVSSMVKGMVCPEQFNPSINFDLDNFDGEVFDKISKGLRGIIMKSPEFANTGHTYNEPSQQQSPPKVDEGFDSIPF